MPLQIDATTRYATGNFTKPLTASQLNSRSPYNTRTHNGLPPTPIDNPGLASIQAAAHPAHTHYLYFVAKPCAKQTRVRDQLRAVPAPAGRATGAATTAAVMAGAERPGWASSGWPVAHSRSPAMQNAALGAPGCSDWRYQLLPVPPELFARDRPGAAGARAFAAPT